jgi:hypothetical protein
LKYFSELETRLSPALSQSAIAALSWEKVPGKRKRRRGRKKGVRVSGTFIG